MVFAKIVVQKFFEKIKNFTWKLLRGRQLSRQFNLIALSFDFYSRKPLVHFHFKNICDTNFTIFKINNYQKILSNVRVHSTPRQCDRELSCALPHVRFQVFLSIRIKVMDANHFWNSSILYQHTGWKIFSKKNQIDDGTS